MAIGEIILFGIPASLLVLALVQLAKNYISERWIPLASVIIGLLVGLTASLVDLTGGWYHVMEYALKGIVIGLVACGLWDNGKKSILNR